MRSLHRNLYSMLKFTKRSKHRGSFLKNMTYFGGDKLFADAFFVVMDRIEADMLQIAKKWNKK